MRMRAEQKVTHGCMDVKTGPQTTAHMDLDLCNRIWVVDKVDDSLSVVTAYMQTFPSGETFIDCDRNIYVPYILH